jgi:hypothetical protein
MSKALEDGLSEYTEKLAEWASSELGMSASHPAGNGDDGIPCKDLWPPPEGAVPAPPEEKYPPTGLREFLSVPTTVDIEHWTYDAVEV